MKKRIGLTSLCILAQLAHGALDIEDREQTDPLLKICTWNSGLLPEQDNLFKHIDPTRAEIQKDRTPQSYKKLWGKSDVLMIHAPSTEKHGFVDFSEITAKSKGALKLYIKNHPYGNHDIRLRRGGEVVEDETIHDGKWEFFKVKFDKQPVVLEVHATQWQWEHCFIHYRIEG